MDFTNEQIERYSRHIILDSIGSAGQEKILKSKILIIGTGGLGSPIALYLAAAGVGTIGIADSDKVDLTNLQRQIIHFTKDIDVLKTESAKEKMNAINPDIEVNTYNTQVTASNITEIINDYDFIVDGTDNFASKFLINDACVLNKKPFSHAGVLRFTGQTTTYIPGQACYRCIFLKSPPPDAVPTCSQAGILGSVAGILGTIQATEVLKFVLGQGDLLSNRLLIIDALKMKFRNIKVNKNPDCPVCGNNPTITELQDYETQICDLQNRN